MMTSNLHKLSWRKWGMSVHLQRSYDTLKTFPCLHISSTIELCLWKWKRLEAKSRSFDMWWVCETALNYNPSYGEPANHLRACVCVSIQMSLKAWLQLHTTHDEWCTHMWVQANIVCTHICVHEVLCLPQQDGVLIGCGGGEVAYSWEENHLWFDECWQKGLLDKSWHS